MHSVIAINESHKNIENKIENELKKTLRQIHKCVRVKKCKHFTARGRKSVCLLHWKRTLRRAADLLKNELNKFWDLRLRKAFKSRR